MRNTDATTSAKQQSLSRRLCVSPLSLFHAGGPFAFGRLKPHRDWFITEGFIAVSSLSSLGEFAGIRTDNRNCVMTVSIEFCAGMVPTVACPHHVWTRLTIELSQLIWPTGNVVSMAAFQKSW